MRGVNFAFSHVKPTTVFVLSTPYDSGGADAPAGLDKGLRAADRQHRHLPSRLQSGRALVGLCGRWELWTAALNSRIVFAQVEGLDRKRSSGQQSTANTNEEGSQGRRHPGRLSNPDCAHFSHTGGMAQLRVMQQHWAIAIGALLPAYPKIQQEVSCVNSTRKLLIKFGQAVYALWACGSSAPRFPVPRTPTVAAWTPMDVIQTARPANIIAIAGVGE